MIQRRLRWYAANIAEISIKAIISKLRAAHYRMGMDSGFRIDEISEREIYGNYLEELEIINTVKTPFGDQKIISYKDYRTIRFRFSLFPPEVEIENPPKSCKGFFNSLDSMFDQSFRIEPLSVNVLNWIKRIEEITAKPKVTRLVVGNFTVAPNVAARMEFRSPIDVRKSVNDFFHNSRYFGIKAALSFPDQNTQTTYELTNNAIAKLKSFNPYDQIQILRLSLVRALDDAE